MRGAAPTAGADRTADAELTAGAELAAGAGLAAGAELGGTETGSVSAFVVLLIVAVMAMLGLVIDGGRAMSAQQSAFDEAEQAARAGAGALSVSALRDGSAQIDTTAAVTSAEAFTVAAGHPGVATVSDGVVRVQIRYRIQTQVLGIVHISTLPVSASATAVDEEGVTEGSP